MTKECCESHAEKLCGSGDGKFGACCGECPAYAGVKLFSDLDWATDRINGTAQLLGDGGTLVAEFNQDELATFLAMTTDAMEVLSGIDVVTRKLTPVEDFEAHTPWDSPLLLGGAGWVTVVGTNWTTNSDVHYWRRPGHPGGYPPAKTIRDKGKDWFFAFTNQADPLPANEPISKLRAYALLHHDDDLSAAVERLRQLGFGDAARKPTKEDCGDPVHEGMTCDQYDASLLEDGEVLITSQEGKIDLSQVEVEFAAGQFDVFKRWVQERVDRYQLHRDAIPEDGVSRTTEPSID